MQYRIKQERTYVTWLTVEADNYDEAETKYFDMVLDGTAYHQELEQMNIESDDYVIYPSHEKETKVS